MSLSVIIPAYNAASTIRKRIESVRKELPKTEIIVVCNGCSDGTEAAVPKGVKILSFPKKLGKGGAITEGIKNTSGDIVAFVDADMSFDARDLKKMISALSDYNCVIASKWKGKHFSEVKESFARKLYGRVWNFLANALFSLGVEDTQAGMKVFMRRFLPDSFVSRGFEFDVELLYAMKKRGARIFEYPVEISETRETTMKTYDVLRMMAGLMRIKLRAP
ncbi:MAG: glycosyltransferase [Candidatus Aenigmarchaeota archaeon]|nr:glycosyltransferase [Candidatus Aenigmarchaeota archaeon]